MSTVDKLMAVFGLFSSAKPIWTVEEAARELRLTQSTAYRYFKALADAGLVVTIHAGSYVLGPAVIVLDRQMRETDPLILIGGGVMHAAHEEFPVPGILLLCRLFRDQVLCVHSSSIGDTSLQVGYVRGRLMPLVHGASSKIILAHLRARTVRPLYDQMPEQFAAARLGESWMDVKRSLRRIRNCRAWATHGDIDPGVVGVASPLFNDQGSILGSLSFVYRDEGLAELEGEIGEVVSRLAQEITRKTA